MNMTEAGYALCVPGNHDDKLLRHLEGKKVQIAHGLELTVRELEQEGREFREKVRSFLRGLVSHYLLDDGKLVVCHAGLPARLQGCSSKFVREFCLYGDPAGELDEYGLPIRNDWAQDYDGKAFVAYGHCPEAEIVVRNNTVCLDGGCVFGGALAALRYPEMEIVKEKTKKEYYPSIKPLMKTAVDSLPDAESLLKRQRIETGLGISPIRDEERSLAAMEIMGRFAADPHWLIYLPPTMSPCETSSSPDYLEHPAEAIAYYKKRGVERLICEEKHMGSRAVVIACKNEETAKKRFNSRGAASGIILTRTGRPFFNISQGGIQMGILDQLRATLSNNGFWHEFDTDWVCLDCEILPWSFKAASLIDSQYAPYGIAAANGLENSLASLTLYADKNSALAAKEKAELASLVERL